jgi:1-deoxy-D-xylulose-5-phosphate reductoisomerase
VSALRQIAILGATGSIGRSTLDVIRRHPDRYRVFAVTTRSRGADLVEICREFQPPYAVISEAGEASRLVTSMREASPRTELLGGPAALQMVAGHAEVDSVMAAIVGAAGLSPTLAAVRAGKRVLLANKEALVLAGGLFMRSVKDHGAQLLPIDSEHNAVFQCLPEGAKRVGGGIRRIVLTGSGGPFRTLRRDDLRGVSPAQACAHPTWKMGPKISVDSATMMNKALEIIEAHWLFGAAPQRIQVVIHPQSVVHSMVEYDDGSVIAQLGQPDMRTPIAQALAYPERIEAGVSSLDLPALATLTFERPDFGRFPALRLAYEVLAAGGCTPAVFNAANEVAVDAFLSGQLPFGAIEEVIEAVLERSPGGPADELAGALAADERARGAAREFIRRMVFA